MHTKYINFEKSIILNKKNIMIQAITKIDNKLMTLGQGFIKIAFNFDQMQSGY